MTTLPPEGRPADTAPKPALSDRSVSDLGADADIDSDAGSDAGSDADTSSDASTPDGGTDREHATRKGAHGRLHASRASADANEPPARQAQADPAQRTKQSPLPSSLEAGSEALDDPGMDADPGSLSALDRPDPLAELQEADLPTPPEPGRPPTLLRTASPVVGGNELRGRMQAAWLRSMLNHIESTVSREDGWQVLEMQLDNGDGTMTIKARRDADRMSITVGFSDPQLRTMAVANEERLRQALQQQYETAVDLSLDSKPQDRSFHRRESPPNGAISGVQKDPLSSTGPDHTTAPPTPVHDGAKHVWVG